MNVLFFPFLFVTFAYCCTIETKTLWIYNRGFYLFLNVFDIFHMYAAYILIQEFGLKI